MHNSPAALSQGQDHHGDARRQAATWNQECSVSSGFGSHSRRVTPSRTVPTGRFLTVPALCTLSQVLYTSSTRVLTQTHGPKPSALTVKHAPYRTHSKCVFTDPPQCASDQSPSTLSRTGLPSSATQLVPCLDSCRCHLCPQF